MYALCIKFNHYMQNKDKTRVVNSGHRIEEDKWRAFMEMCEAYRVTGNHGLNRLVDEALENWYLPGFKRLAKPPPQK
jgi:hypothetical protein